ncbi:MAG: sensor histidine kinase [Granulosicoccus sp.]
MSSSRPFDAALLKSTVNTSSASVDVVSDAVSDPSIDSSPDQVPVSMFPVTELLQTLNEPVALFDSSDLSLHWVSDQWRSKFAALKTGSSLSSCKKHLPELGGSIEQVLSSTASATTEISWSAGRLGDVFRITPLRDQFMVIRLVQAPDIDKPLQQYLESREGLFSTSSTISVSEMATTLAHEINQPVGTITNLIRGLQARLGGQNLSTEQLSQALDQILEQAVFTGDVISRIRDFTHARRPTFVPIDVHVLLSDAVSLLDWMIKTSGCAVHWELGTDKFIIDGDQVMLQQVVINVVRNAIEAMHEVPAGERTIRIACRTVKDRLRLTVTDVGHGPAGEEHWFLPFVTDKPGGMGVGLNICRSFIELHQGRLWLAPGSDGGCTVTIELPLLKTREMV